MPPEETAARTEAMAVARELEPAGPAETANGAGRGVLEGALQVLEELSRVGEAGLTRLAAGAGLPKATTYRLLDQLVTLGMVQRGDGHYRIGVRMFRLGQAWQPAPVLRAASREPLPQLAAVSGYASIGLSVPELGQSTLVAGMRGELDEIRPWRAGTLLPRGCAADVVSAGRAVETPRPPRYSPAEWKRLVTRAADEGVAFDHTRSEPWHASCLAVPVHAPSGEVAATVTVAAFDGRRLPGIAPAAQRAARMISANLARLERNGS